MAPAGPPSKPLGREPVLPTLDGITAPFVASLLFGLSQTQALVILFVVVPVVAAAVIVPLMVWWMSKGPKPVLTSELLAHGVPAQGEILRVRSLGNVLDVRPMVRFTLRVTMDGGEPFEMEVVQALPRSMVGVFRPGDLVRLRLAPDRSAGAIEWGYEPPEH